jgi:transcription termination factor Rho
MKPEDQPNSVSEPSPEPEKKSNFIPPPPIQAPTGQEEITKISDLQRMDIDDLNDYARNIGLRHLGALTKSQMVFEIAKAKSERPNEILVGEGVLEVLPDGFGFLRFPNYNYMPSAEDIYVSPAQIRRFDLKKEILCMEHSDPPKTRKNILLF